MRGNLEENKMAIFKNSNADIYLKKKFLVSLIHILTKAFGSFGVLSQRKSFSSFI